MALSSLSGLFSGGGNVPVPGGSSSHGSGIAMMSKGLQEIAAIGANIEQRDINDKAASIGGQLAEQITAGAFTRGDGSMDIQSLNSHVLKSFSHITGVDAKAALSLSGQFISPYLDAEKYNHTVYNSNARLRETSRHNGVMEGKGAFTSLIGKDGSIYSVNKNTGAIELSQDAPSNYVNPSNLQVITETAYDNEGREITSHNVIDKVAQYNGQNSPVSPYQPNGATQPLEESSNGTVVNPHAVNQQGTIEGTIDGTMGGNSFSNIKPVKSYPDHVVNPDGTTVQTNPYTGEVIKGADGKPYVTARSKQNLTNTDRYKANGIAEQQMMALGSGLLDIYRTPGSVAALGSNPLDWAGNKVADITGYASDEALARRGLKAQTGPIIATMRNMVEVGIMTDKDYDRYEALIGDVSSISKKELSQRITSVLNGMVYSAQGYDPQMAQNFMGSLVKIGFQPVQGKSGRVYVIPSGEEYWDTGDLPSNFRADLGIVERGNVLKTPALNALKKKEETIDRPFNPIHVKEEPTAFGQLSDAASGLGVSLGVTSPLEDDNIVTRLNEVTEQTGKAAANFGSGLMGGASNTVSSFGSLIGSDAIKDAGIQGEKYWEDKIWGSKEKSAAYALGDELSTDALFMMGALPVKAIAKTGAFNRIVDFAKPIAEAAGKAVSIGSIPVTGPTKLAVKMVDKTLRKAADMFGTHPSVIRKMLAEEEFVTKDLGHKLTDTFRKLGVSQSALNSVGDVTKEAKTLHGWLHREAIQKPIRILNGSFAHVRALAPASSEKEAVAWLDSVMRGLGNDDIIALKDIGSKAGDLFGHVKLQDKALAKFLDNYTSKGLSDMVLSMGKTFTVDLAKEGGDATSVLLSLILRDATREQTERDAFRDKQKIEREALRRDIDGD